MPNPGFRPSRNVAKPLRTERLWQAFCAAPRGIAEWALPIPY